MSRRSPYCLIALSFLVFLLAGCEKDDASVTVTDIDGNNYQTVVIGSQIWMAENLRATRLNDGTEISLITKNHEWYSCSSPAFSWYNNDSSLFRVPYGALYNGYVAADDRICPAGWHVPSYDEVMTMISALGDSATAGGMLKTEGLNQWHYPNTGGGNSTGFTALPAGMRYFEGTFSSMSYFTAYWTRTEADTSSLYFISLSYLDQGASVSSKSRKNGFSIRCIKD